MKLFPLLLVWFFILLNHCSAANVTYDRRSLIIDGHRKLVISAAIHYPRRYDLVKFVKIVQQAGMYMILRIGPFIAAEWNFGGIPVWLHYVPGTMFRTDNEPFKYYMQKFVTFIVNLMKQEKLFASQGGPIILAQVENEYGFYEQFYGEGAERYVTWAARMAVSQNIGGPWIICQQDDAPDPMINTCNSFYCDKFMPNSPNQPKIWTENWPGWFKTFGARDPHRPPEDIAFSVARFFQKGGSVQHYYMYHGGTNFGQTSGGPFITTIYDYEAPIDEYGLPRLPKWGHLKDLHRAIKLCEQALQYSESTTISLGPSQEADVYDDGLGVCAAFLANMDDKIDKNVIFRNVSYNLPAWSVSILPDCKNVVFNMAKVGSQTSVVEMVPDDLQPSVAASPSKGLKAHKWDIFVENAGIWGVADFTKNGFVDHINTTKDTTDYLCIIVGENEEFLKKGSRTVLIIESKGHALHASVNQELQGSTSGNGSHSPFKFENPISLEAGKNEIALLSMTVGLQNAGGLYEWVGAGLTSVKIKGLNNGTIDLSKSSWTYKIGLQGEHLGVYKPDSLNGVKWVSASDPPKNKPLTWNKVAVDPSSGDEPVGLDMIHMGKGLAWLNGEQIGRYWPIKSSKHEKCVEECDYRGKFFPDKCLTGCGEPTQRWYHVPRSWFKPSGNILVIFEEKGGDPTKIKFSKRKTSSVCSLVPEDYPTAMVDQESMPKDGRGNYKTGPPFHLKCPKNTLISNVKLASFGNPTGRCGSYRKGDCHDPNLTFVVEKVCLGKSECGMEIAEENFDKSLCPGTTKKLATEAVGS